MNQGPETVAAVIGEPISTAAGVHVPSPKYWQMLREICDKHGVLLIADEVINGFGRTGKMFAIEQFGVVPDIMTIAKGLSSGYAPIAAAIVRDSVFEIFKEKQEADRPPADLRRPPGRCAAAAIKNLEIFERENLVEQGAEKGAYSQQARGAARPSDRRRCPRRGHDLGARARQEQEGQESLGPKDHGFIRKVQDVSMAERRDHPGLGRDAFRAAAGDHEGRDRPMVAIADEALTAAEKEFAGEITD